jgi:hypothetical protein
VPAPSAEAHAQVDPELDAEAEPDAEVVQLGLFS